MQVRLGTADQNPELQPREIQDYAGRQGWQIVETYPDTISGAKASRPGLNRLMADAMSRKFDCLLISKLDRFGCSLVAFTIATCVSATAPETRKASTDPSRQPVRWASHTR